jgi:hypothetical protein
MLPLSNDFGNANSGLRMKGDSSEPVRPQGVGRKDDKMDCHRNPYLEQSGILTDDPLFRTIGRSADQLTRTLPHANA